MISYSKLCYGLLAGILSCTAVISGLGGLSSSGKDDKKKSNDNNISKDLGKVKNTMHQVSNAMETLIALSDSIIGITKPTTRVQIPQSAFFY